MSIKLTTPYSKYKVEKSVKHKINFAPNTLPCTFLGEPCQQSFNAFFHMGKVIV